MIIFFRIACDKWRLSNFNQELWRKALMNKLFIATWSMCAIVALNLATAAPLPADPSAESETIPVQATYKVRLANGSLEANVRQIIRRFPEWKYVVWDAPNDYHWTGAITLTGTSAQNLLAQILKDYPVQAIFWHGNSVVQIKARNK